LSYFLDLGLSDLYLDSRFQESKTQ